MKTLKVEQGLLASVESKSSSEAQIVSDIWAHALRVQGIAIDKAKSLAVNLLHQIMLGESIRGTLFIEPSTGVVWWHPMILAVMPDKHEHLKYILEVCTAPFKGNNLSPELTRCLATKPRRAENRIYDLHIGLRKLGEIKYNRFIQPLHVGILRYADQMRNSSPQKRNHNLGGALSSTLILLKALSEDKVQSSFESILDSLDEISEIKLARLDGEPYSAKSYPRMRHALCLLVDPDMRQVPFKSIKPHSKLSTSASPEKRESEGQDEAITSIDGSTDDEPTAETEVEDALEKEHEKPLARYTRGVMALAHYMTRTNDGVLPIYIYARLLSCLMADPSHTQVQHNLHQLILVTLAITLGRSLSEIAQSLVCQQIDESLTRDRLVFCLNDGCLYYRPQKYLFPDTVLAEIKPADTVLTKQQKRYHPSALVYQVPLSTNQRKEIAYLAQQHTCASSALFCNATGDDWNDADTNHFLQTLNEHIQHVHRGYRTITGTEFARSYVAHGHHLIQLDPVAAYFITGHLPKRLEMPVRYTQVNSTAIGQVNEQMDQALRSAIAHDLRYQL